MYLHHDLKKAIIIKAALLLRLKETEASIKSKQYNNNNNYNNKNSYTTKTSSSPTTMTNHNISDNHNTYTYLKLRSRLNSHGVAVVLGWNGTGSLYDLKVVGNL